METVIQFGTGNFLRAFADDFLNKMNEKGLYTGKSVIVSPTDSPQVDVLNAQQIVIICICEEWKTASLSTKLVYGVKRIVSIATSTQKMKNSYYNYLLFPIIIF